MNSCYNDDNTIEFLIHDEDNDFTKAHVIIADDTDNDDNCIPFFSQLFAMVILTLETLPPTWSNVVFFTSCISFLMVFGDIFPFNMQHTSRISGCQLDCSMTSCHRWLQTMTTSDRRQTWGLCCWVRWDCHCVRGSAHLSVCCSKQS